MSAEALGTQFAEARVCRKAILGRCIFAWWPMVANRMRPNEVCGCFPPKRKTMLTDPRLGGGSTLYTSSHRATDRAGDVGPTPARKASRVFSVDIMR